VSRTPLTFGISYLAGVLSGLLGIGGVKVPATPESRITHVLGEKIFIFGRPMFIVPNKSNSYNIGTNMS
jgi:hypothetical protein